MSRHHKNVLMSTWSTVDGLRVHTRSATSLAPAGRTPIVFVHGLSVSSRYMVPTAERLASARPVYAPDLPGFGKSEHPQRILDIPALADALMRWIDLAGLDQVVMLGNSMGCQIIADAALRYPGRITQAILTGPTMDSHGRNAWTQAWRLLRDLRYEPLSSIATQGRDYWACGVRRTLGTLRAALADRIEDKLPAMRFPTLVVRGAHDPIAPQRWVEEMASLLPQGRLAVIGAAPHAINYDAPTTLAHTVLEFLEAQRAARAPVASHA